MERSRAEMSLVSLPLKDEDAAKKLEVVIFNLISLGEWEAAKGHVRSLASRNGTRQRAKQLLKTLIFSGQDFWKESPSVPSSHHLSWLALQSFVELFPDNKAELPDTIEELIKFHLLMFNARTCEGHTPQLEEWLNGYFRTHVIKTSLQVPSPPHTFPNSVQRFLRSLVSNNPPLGHAFLSCLTVTENAQYLLNNETLQLMYIDCIDTSLSKIETEGEEVESHVGVVEDLNDKVEHIYNMLSLMDPWPEMTRMIKNVDRVLLKLLQSGLSRGGENEVAGVVFKPEIIYSCLIGRSSPILIQRYQDIEEFLGVDLVQDTSVYQEVESERHVLNSNDYWKTEFYRALKEKQHFLERIIESGLQCICSAQLDKLANLLTDDTLSPLRPLLLLLGWDRYPDIGKGKELLDVLWPQTQDVEPLLFAGCCKLAFQVGLVQWCLEKARPFLPSGQTPLPHASAGDVFQGLKSHSILYVLHHSTPLSSINPLEVIDILKLQPESSSMLPSRRPIQSPIRPATPTSPGLMTTTLSHEQQRDIATYQSFYCLKLIMEATWSTVLIKHGLLMTSAGEKNTKEEDQTQGKQENTKSKVVRKLDYGISEPLEVEESGIPLLEYTYLMEVSKRLDEAKGHLSEIFPLHYRLEVLENIFSLLFLSSDDLQKSDDFNNQTSGVSLENVRSSASRSSGAESDILINAHSVNFIRKQQGFLVNEKLAFDILNILNDAMFQLTATKYALLSSPSNKGRGDGGVSVPLGSLIISSIHPSTLQQRTAKLQKLINEAKWRLQLVSSKNGISSITNVTNEDLKGGVSSDEESISDVSDHEETEEQKERKEVHLKNPPLIRKTRSKDIQKSLESSSSFKGPSPIGLIPIKPQSAPRGLLKTSSGPNLRTQTSKLDKTIPTSSTDDGHCADIEDRSPVQCSKRKKLRSRNDSTSKSRKSSPSVHKGSGIICQMLASPDSLLCKCLRHRNYHRAKEVLKMFNMEGQLGESLVLFAEQFEAVSDELKARSQSSTPRPTPFSLTPNTDQTHTSTPPISLTGGGGVTLQAAIMNATNHSPGLESLHRLLAPANIKEMLFAGNKDLEKPSFDMPLLSLLHDNVPSLIMLDILISRQIEGQTAKRIVNMAVTRSKVALEGLSPRVGDSHLSGRRSFQERKSSGGLEKPLQGPLGLLHTLSEVSGYFVLTSPMSSPTITTSSPTSSISSPHSLLTQFQLPLRIDIIQQWKEFSDSYWDTRDQLEDLVSKTSTQGDALELLTQSNGDHTSSQHVFSDVLGSMKLFPSSLRKGDEEGVEHIQYLYHLGVYLLKFVQLLMNTLGVAAKATPTQILSIIHESPTHLIGRLVFEKAISPQRLEQFMSDLPHLKIVEVIVKCCCPHIPSLPPEKNLSLPFKSDVYPLNVVQSNGFGDVGGVEEGGMDDPCELSHKLLSKMIATLKGLCISEDGHVTAKDLLAASQTTEMKKVFACTSQLASLTLSSLKEHSNRQIAFFCNVTNLLYAHTLMMFLQEEGRNEGRKLFGGGRLSLNVLQSDRIACVTLFSRVGYYIGELGLVSLYDLHYSILRHGLSPPVLDKYNSLRLRPNTMTFDPWYDHLPSQPDSRVLYVISDGTLSSPVPRLLLPDHLHSDLDTAEAKYIRANVTFDISKSQVKIPKLLSDHRNDFIPRKCHYEEDNPFRALSNIALIRYIIRKLPKESEEQLSAMLDSCDPNRARRGSMELKVEIIDENLTAGYDFPPTRRSVLGDGTSPIVRRTVPKVTSSRRYEKIKPYTFTEETVAFVRQQAPLLASLVCLLCPPESLSSPPQLDYITSESSVVIEDTSKTTPTDKDGGEGGKGAFIQTLNLRRSRPKESFKRSQSISDETKIIISHPSREWQEAFDKISMLFTEGTPLKKFLLSRVQCFKGILPWDRLIQEPISEEGHGNGDKDYLDPTINLRTLAVIPGQSPELGHACLFVLRKLLRRGMLTEALKFLKTEPVVNNRERIQFILDLVFSSSFIAMATEREKISKEKEPNLNPLVLVHQLSDIELSSRLTLSYLEVWPVTTCVNLLMHIHYHLPSSSAFVPIVHRRLYQLHVYQKIVETVESPDDKTLEPRPCPWRHWSQLAYDSKERCDYVLNILLKNKAFSLAREWVQVHGHGDDITRQIEEEYIYDLLEGSDDISDPYTAQGVLEDLSSESMKLSVCEGLLSRCHKLESIMLVLQFLLSHLVSQIPSEKKIKSLTNQLLGVKALLTLPKFIQDQYRPLMREPLLIVEQLLIDVKIEWAAKVIEQLSEDEYISYIDTSDCPTLEPRPSILSDEHTNPFIYLLVFYAEKSLEFPLPSKSDTPAGSRAASPSIPPTPTPFVRPLERVRSPTEPPSNFGTVPPTPRNRKSCSFTFPHETKKYSRFEPPPHPPSKDNWDADSKSKYCHVCKTAYFGMFSRRHHCRRCGRVVCNPCSSHIIQVEGYETQQRVCDDCYDYHILISGSSDDILSVELDDDTDLAKLYPGLGLSSQFPWRLISQDAHFNQNLRREFYYDVSPSTLLCLAVVDLIQDIRLGAGFILHCCHNVSIQLVPDDHGKVNEEIDHYFTISIMENLLQNAKLRFTRAGDSSGVELCDTYLSRVDLLRLLVSSQYSEIPSIQELTRPELARRVRDKLIADDRYKLAMEVSTKCLLDTSAVWSAWGMASIRAGDFNKARELLRHCFQVSSQSSPSSGGSHLLERIVEQILTSPLVSVKQSEDWSETVKNTMMLSEQRHDVALMDSKRFNECCHYINMYGTAGMMVGFLSRHHCWKEACTHVLKNKCSTDVFVNHLWIPGLKSGQLEHLEECLRSTDPSLSKWEQYLTAVCRLLSQRRLYHILYHTQLFMKDFVRSAMTCIKFYIGFSGRSTTIEELYLRRKYLETARQHFQSAIEASQPRGRMFGISSRDESSSRGSGGTLPRNMNIQDMQMHIHTVCLQITITELLYKASIVSDTLQKPVPVVNTGGIGKEQQQPATLFSTGIVRGEVTCHLLTSCQDFTEGFQVAYEIISAYRLPANRVLSEVAKQLALKERYVDVRLLVQCVQKSSLSSSELNDEICMAAIKVLANQSKEARQLDKHLEKIIQAITNDKNKIKALIQCGKLKNAYLVAIKARLHEEVELIADVAAKANQLGVRDICEKWLQQHQSHHR